MRPILIGLYLIGMISVLASVDTEYKKVCRTEAAPPLGTAWSRAARSGFWPIYWVMEQNGFDPIPYIPECENENSRAPTKERRKGD